MQRLLLFFIKNTENSLTKYYIEIRLTYLYKPRTVYCIILCYNAVLLVYFNGGRYGVVCSYDLMERKLMSNYKRFSYAGMRSISFSVLNNDFKAFDFGCCLKSQSLRFVLNIVKKID